ncbi:MAG TPA: hypothetical protein VLF91_02660 [Candidatus Saccharimonadales bacterium]|nr:hypothetical protein [Candidatus Saccharimonadales bacterium]
MTDPTPDQPAPTSATDRWSIIRIFTLIAMVFILAIATIILDPNYHTPLAVDITIAVMAVVMNAVAISELLAQLLARKFHLWEAVWAVFCLVIGELWWVAMMDVILTK